MNHLRRGGKSKIERLLGVSHNTINRGLKELREEVASKPTERIRKAGGGRKKKVTPNIWEKIEFFIEPHKRGEPESPLQWFSKSLRNIETALKKEGVSASHRIIGEALKEKGFSLQANRLPLKGWPHRCGKPCHGCLDDR